MKTLYLICINNLFIIYVIHHFYGEEKILFVYRESKAWELIESLWVVKYFSSIVVFISIR